MSFGTNLTARRKQRGLSQEEFGAALGVSRQTIYTWEADISSPNIENLRAIADYFGCSADDLIRAETGTQAATPGSPGTTGTSGISAAVGATRFADKPETFRSAPESSDTQDAPKPPPVCRGDKTEITAFIHRFAFCIALATALILLGISALILLAGDMQAESAGLCAFFISLSAAVALYIYSGITHASFMERPENQNFALLYTKEEKQADTRRFAVVLSCAVVGILLGILLCCLAYVHDETLTGGEPAWPAAAFMGILAVCVGLIINFSIRLSKYEDKPPETQNKTADAIHSILWMVTVTAYLVMGFVFNLWHPGWIIFVFSGFASGIISVLFEQKNND